MTIENHIKLNIDNSFEEKELPFPTKNLVGDQYCRYLNELYYLFFKILIKKPHFLTQKHTFFVYFCAKIKK